MYSNNFLVFVNCQWSCCIKMDPSAPQRLQNKLLPVLDNKIKWFLFSENLMLLKYFLKTAEVSTTHLSHSCVFAWT